MTVDTQRLAQLSPEKRLLLEMLLKKKRAGNGAEEAVPAPPPEPRERPPAKPFDLLGDEDRAQLPPDLEDAYPLGMAQLGMLYHMDLAPEDPTPAYHNVNSWHARGPFDGAVFQEAVNRVVRSHPILRTSFDLTGYSEPMQLVHRKAHLPVVVVDLRDLSEEERWRQIQHFIEVENRRLMDLSKPPLMRFHVHRRSDETFQFTLTEPHAISDGWSTTSTLAEIFELYFKLLRGETVPEEAPLVGSYRDFVQREREMLDSAECREYWDRVLEDCNVVRLPRWPKSYRGRRGREDRKPYYLLDRDMVSGLRRTADRAGVPLKSVFLASYFKALSLVSGLRDLNLGLVTNARPEQRDGERLRGLFLNPLPLRVRIPDGSWIDLVRAVFEAEVEMLPYRVYPLQALQSKWGREPLFEAAFTFLNFHSVENLLGSGDIELLDLEEASDLSVTHFTLSVLFRTWPMDPLRIALLLEFDDAELTAGQIEAWWQYFRQILEAMAAEPESSHDGRSYLTAEQRRQLEAWNRTADAGEPPYRNVAQWVTARAKADPRAPAVRGADGVLTYADLEERSGRLARHLAARGVGPEVPVGLLLDRSPELVVAVLAVLRAGGVYVPLDPKNPQERLGWVLQQAAPPLVLTRGAVADLVPEGPERVLLDAGWEERLEAPGETPDGGGVDADNLAYVIFTSGSTGRPKGVMVSHGALANYLAWAVEAYGLEGGGGAPLHSSVGFDLAVTSLLAPLVSGGAVHLVAEEDGVDALARALDPDGAAVGADGERFGFVKLTPSHLEMLARLLPMDAPPPMDVLVVGGEALAGGTLEPWRRHAGTLRVFNEYGPTEATVGCAVFEVPLEGADGDTVPVGRPIAHSRVHLLDEEGYEVPLGAPGELHVAGRGLARGYLGRPAETALRFVPDADSPEPGGRLYRTGDIARWLPDGQLDFLGRRDDQVKVRGHRIELGEIEAVLKGHPAVADVVVVARTAGGATAGPHDLQLVAYVVGESGAPALEELRTWLEERLPEVMVPAFFVPLGALPLTPNGKVDRRALPAPDHVRSELDGAFLAPRNPVEEVLCGVFAEVLGRSELGIYDDFFRLGGHSLLATQVVSRLRRVFHLELPLQMLFDHPTAADLAVQVDRLMRRDVGPEELPLEPADRDRPLPLSFSQQRLWFLDRLIPGTSTYNLPTALRLSGHLREDVLQRCLDEVVRRHEVLRTTFDGSGDQPVQVVHPPRPVPLPRLDLTALPAAPRDAEVERLAAAEAARPFDLAAGPLLRVRLLELAREEHALLVTLHHIVSDGWSRGILVREVSTLYESFVHGRPSPFADLEIQYADFAVWQRKWLTGPVLTRHLDFWRRELEGVPSLLELPTDRPRPPVATSHGAALIFELPPALGEAVKAEARRQGVTPFMWLLAAFDALLYRWSGQGDFVVGSPIANRNRFETEGLIGFFVNALALRARIAPGDTFLDLLGQVRQRTLDAYSHQDLPFEKLVDELELRRDVSHSPLFQVMFALQNAPRKALELSGLTLELLGAEHGTARFDLTLAMEERGSVLSGMLEYNTDLFDADTAQRLIAGFTGLVERLVAEPDRALDEVPLLSEEERSQVLEMGLGPAMAPSPEPTFEQLVARHAAATPDAPAVSQDGRGLTYGELDRRAEGLARHLRRLGVGPDVRVGVCVDRSPELVVALLAVARAGGVWVPLDPEYPLERLAYMLEDSGARVVVAQDSLREVVQDDRLTFVSADGVDWAARAGEDAPAPVAAGPDDLVYVIHTSGSTGRPKGVMVRHGALTTFLRAMARRPGFTADDVMLAVTSLSFDISGLELLLPLVVGGRVEVAEREIVADGPRLGERLAACGATVMQGTPATWRILLDSGWEGDRKLAACCGGEALPPSLAARLVDRVGSVWNLYGPTETTIWSAVERIEPPAERVGVERISVGRPIHGTRVHVLDRRGEPVPRGVVGEVVLSGAGLARGYQGRPAETAAVFVPDPYVPNPSADEAGSRAYRTGDLGRFRADGRLDLLGRRDHQVKVQGFRIELAEVESVLERHPQLREAAVAVHGRGAGRRLVAYVVPREEPGPAVDELRAFLASHLPDYMVPAVVVPLEALPRTPNRKVDRKALPEPERSRPELSHGFVAPRGDLERTLVEIWREVLDLEQVGVEDNFFDLGGNSMLLVQVHRREQERLGRDLPLTLLFQYPTVAALAARLEQSGEDGEVGGRARQRQEAQEARRGLAARRRARREEKGLHA